MPCAFVCFNFLAFAEVFDFLKNSKILKQKYPFIYPSKEKNKFSQHKIEIKEI